MNKHQTGTWIDVSKNMHLDKLESVVWNVLDENYKDSRLIFLFQEELAVLLHNDGAPTLNVTKIVS